MVSIYLNILLLQICFLKIFLGINIQNILKILITLIINKNFNKIYNNKIRIIKINKNKSKKKYLFKMIFKVIKGINGNIIILMKIQIMSYMMKMNIYIIQKKLKIYLKLFKKNLVKTMIIFMMINNKFMPKKFLKPKKLMKN